jgi:C4-dicarboxylate-specific signal transduction histidine kinase
MKSRRFGGQTVAAHSDRVATLSHLSAVIAHEVAQPISAMLINAQAAIRKLDGELTRLEEVRQALGRIVRDANRASEMITRIRTLAHASPQRWYAVEINEVVRSAIDLSSSELLANRVAVRTRLAARLPVVAGDRIQLQQVLTNLIQNAIAAMRETPAGARHLLITTARLKSDTVLVGVLDSGPGLALNQLERIFNVFYTTKPGGMGMGLSICRTIVETHGGQLWAAPHARSGAVFQFTLQTYLAAGRSRSPAAHRENHRYARPRPSLCRTSVEAGLRQARI